jgi:hypothetical protein
MPRKKKSSPRVNQKAKAYLAKKVRRKKMPPKDPSKRAKKLTTKYDPRKKK